MTLPGESISKYKGDEPHTSANVPSEALAQHNAPTHEHERGFLQDAASAGPVPHQAVASAHHEQSVAVAAVPDALSPLHDEDNMEGDRQAKHEAERFAPMKVTPVFTGDDADVEEFDEVEVDEARQSDAAISRKASSASRVSRRRRCGESLTSDDLGSCARNRFRNHQCASLYSTRGK